MTPVNRNNFPVILHNTAPMYLRTGDYEEKPLTKMNTGDGILWNGWTEHGINPVTKGARYVLIVHFTGVLKSS